MKSQVTEIQSSVVTKLGYNSETKTMMVEFNSGSIYAYKNVPAEIWAAVLVVLYSGASVGKILNKEVFRVFPCVRLD